MPRKYLKNIGPNAQWLRMNGALQMLLNHVHLGIIKIINIQTAVKDVPAVRVHRGPSNHNVISVIVVLSVRTAQKLIKRFPSAAIQHMTLSVEIL